jgi:hypothetical protein
MNAVIPGLGMVFIEPGDSAQPLNELPTAKLIRITHSITFGTGEYFICNAWIRRAARRAAHGAQRQAGAPLSVSRMLLIKIAPAFSDLNLLPFRDTRFYFSDVAHGNEPGAIALAESGS